MPVDLSLADDACAGAFGEAVTITPAGQPAFEAIAIIRRGERTAAFSGRDFAAPAVVAEIRKSQWPDASKGAAIAAADGTYTVDHVGQDDAGICWRLDLKVTDSWSVPT